MKKGEDPANDIKIYLKPEDRYITITFAEREGDRLIQKGVYCKAARGAAVRIMAENQIEDPEQLQKYTVYGHRYSETESTTDEYVFIKEQDERFR